MDAALATEPPVTGTSTTPATWLLLGDKRGDNGQIEAIAEALGWPLTRVRLNWKKPYDIEKPKPRPTLDHVDPATSDEFGPPWPDLIITVGRRPSMVAAWIKEQSAGRTRIALFGKPSGLMDRFDLIIATGESQMPPMDNVVMIPMPLMRVAEDEIAAEVELWAERLSQLPRPLIAVFIGGPTGPYIFNERLADRLIDFGAEIVREQGTPYFVTSRRTPNTLTDRLRNDLPQGAVLAAWDPGAIDNPYKALLGSADGFVVTGDSISMMVEIARLKRPLKIFPLPLSTVARLDQLRRAATVRIFSHDLHDNPDARLRRWLARSLFRLNILHHTRDFEAFQQSLIKRGLATSMKGLFVTPTAAIEDDAAIAAHRIALMMDQSSNLRRP